MNMKNAAILLVMGIFLMMTAGCDPQTEKGKPVESTAPATVTDKPSSPQKSSPTVPGEEKQEAVKVLSIEVYYPNEDGTRLTGVAREIEVTPYKDKYTAAIEMQMRAPKEKNLIDIFPKSAKLRGIRLEGSTAVVDFDSSTARGFVGGSTGEEMLVGSVVNTLTNFPEVKDVRFLVDGNPVETLAGHMDLTMPIKRMTGLLK